MPFEHSVGSYGALINLLFTRAVPPIGEEAHAHDHILELAPLSSNDESHTRNLNPAVDLEANMQGTFAKEECVPDGQAIKNTDTFHCTVIPEEFTLQTTEPPKL